VQKILIAALLIGVPAAALAQGRPATPGGGPLVLERIENRFVVAPDYKVTAIDGDTGQLAGAYAGWLAEDTLLIGGAAYWLADGPADAALTYGGLLVGWNTPGERRIQFGARGLVGVGRAELARDVAGFARFGSRHRGTGPTPIPDARTVRVIGEDDFFVFEPQLALTTKLSKHLGVALGAGYRLTGYTEFAGDRLRGVTGSIALQILP
jgi:hypothetical protein